MLILNGSQDEFLNIFMSSSLVHSVRWSFVEIERDVLNVYQDWTEMLYMNVQDCIFARQFLCNI